MTLQPLLTGKGFLTDVAGKGNIVTVNDQVGFMVMFSDKAPVTHIASERPFKMARLMVF